MLSKKLGEKSASTILVRMRKYPEDPGLLKSKNLIQTFVIQGIGIVPARPVVSNVKGNLFREIFL